MSKHGWSMKSMNDAPDWVPGEVFHRSPQLLAGYWEKLKETAEAFAGGWFHSGDLGYFDEAGYLYIVDRIKDVINTGGVLVASREVEDVLLGHPDVSEVAVVAKLCPDPKWIEAVGAFVVLRPGAVGERRGDHRLRPHPSRSVQDSKTGDLRRESAPEHRREGAQT